MLRTEVVHCDAANVRRKALVLPSSLLPRLLGPLGEIANLTVASAPRLEEDQLVEVVFKANELLVAKCSQAVEAVRYPIGLTDGALE